MECGGLEVGIGRDGLKGGIRSGIIWLALIFRLQYPVLVVNCILW